MFYFLYRTSSLSEWQSRQLKGHTFRLAHTTYRVVCVTINMKISTFSETVTVHYPELKIYD